MVAVVGLFVVLGWFFVCCLCLPSRFRDHFSSLQERTTVGAVMARTAWEKKKDLFKLLRLYKSWAFCKSLISDGLQRYVLVLFPSHPFVSFVPCFSSAVQVDPRTFLLDTPHSMRLANGPDLTALASVSSSRPP